MSRRISNLQNGRRRLVPLVCGMLACAAAMAGPDVRVSVTNVPTLPDHGDLRQIISAVLQAPVQSPEGVWEAGFVRGAERSFDAVLHVPLGPLIGVATTRRGSDDVFMAKWRPGSPTPPEVRDISILDAPDYSWIILGCDPSAFDSSAATLAFLERNLRWIFAVPDQPMKVTVSYAGATSQNFLDGRADLLQPEYEGEYYIFGVRVEASAFLVLKIGNGRLRYAGYPDGSLYVPERFPPLAGLVKEWSKDRLISEVGALRSRSIAFANNNDRDRILISEAARRGLARSDLEVLLEPTAPFSYSQWKDRATALVTALADSGQLERDRDALSEITLKLGRRAEAGGAVDGVFRTLLESPSDFSTLAIECLSTCTMTGPAIAYLGERGTTEEAYLSVKRVAVSGTLAQADQQYALGKIRARIDKEQRKR